MEKAGKTIEQILHWSDWRRRHQYRAQQCHCRGRGNDRLTELKNRGLNDILIACVDGLKGFPDAINAVYSETRIQLSIVHMLRNNLRFVAGKDNKAVTRDLKTIYQVPTEDAALQALDAFSET
ncbi:Putative transposase [Xenorhabdus bovienii str. Jollieti]|uniref:Mutator family transposase n=1 Tax=Xenorhabdus bovienii (strain SS-2004) TaxID=406818 RepID=D3V3I5_XENBS|nr:Putative transposase [Xenorhabdus bovienii SS-2004]CDH28074.1 Putative transposase [Xenorhabdus bovienii str. Jollieti]